MRIILLIILIIPVNVNADEIDWNWRTTSNVLILMDWSQTLDIAENPNYYETNPVLGRDPDRGEVNLYFVSMLLLNNWIGEQLGDGWYIVVSMNQAVYVTHNFKLGVTLSF
jgi:hypothetical protein